MYLSVREALHDIQSLRVSEKDISCFFETWMSERARDETHDLRLFKQAAFSAEACVIPWKFKVKICHLYENAQNRPQNKKKFDGVRKWVSKNCLSCKIQNGRHEKTKVIISSPII